jgi:hypothetical protein
MLLMLIVMTASLSARWEGSIEIPGDAIRCVIDLAQDAQGKWIGSATMPGFGIQGVPLAEIKVKDSAVEFTIPGAFRGSKFKGQLTPAGALTGTFQQAGNSASVKLTQAGAAQVEPSERASPPIDPNALGEWQGECDFMGGKLQVRLTLATEMSNGVANTAAKMTLKKTRETVLTEVTVSQEAQWLVVRSRPYGVTLEGRFKKDAKEIAGTIELGNLETPLVLHPKS